MGALDFPQKQTAAKIVVKGKKKRKRVGIRFDMTPMVDIAFLLLIFYMVTTVFAMPQSIELNLPPKGDKTIQVAESRILQILVDKNGDIFWQHSESSDKPMNTLEYLPLEDLRRLLLDKNLAKRNLVTIVQIDPKCRYDLLVQILDDIQVTERLIKQIEPEWSYTFSLQDMTEWEAQLIVRARQERENSKSHEKGGVS